jgi:hypothetical protein
MTTFLTYYPDSKPYFRDILCYKDYLYVTNYTIDTTSVAAITTPYYNDEATILYGNVKGSYGVAIDRINDDIYTVTAPGNTSPAGQFTRITPGTPPIITGLGFDNTIKPVDHVVYAGYNSGKPYFFGINSSNPKEIYRIVIDSSDTTNYTFWYVSSDDYATLAMKYDLLTKIYAITLTRIDIFYNTLSGTIPVSIPLNSLVPGFISSTNYGLSFDSNFEYLYFAASTSGLPNHMYRMTTSDNTLDTSFVPIDCSLPVFSISVDQYDNIYIVTVNSSNEYTILQSSPVFCFNKGTKIRCLNQQLADEYVAIELLKVGDFVKTYKHGYRKISKIISGSFRNNPKKWNMCMYKMAKTESNGLLEDLIVTGGHSLLVDSISETEQANYDELGLTEWCKDTIDGKRLLLSSVSDHFKAIQDTEKYNYYHLLLENNDDEEERFGIWANGVLTETPNVKSVSK